ncbi:ArsA family ATPase, partial [Streptomyces sp. SID8455]|nr:ArsA family ATPase [Streptomyces sp. SID8455]
VERLAAEDMPLAGLVLNRAHGSEASRLSAEQALAAAENLDDARIVDQTAGKAGFGDQEAPDPADTDPAATAPSLSPEHEQEPEHRTPHKNTED